MNTSAQAVECLKRGKIPNVRSEIFRAITKTVVYDITGRNTSTGDKSFGIYTRIAGVTIGKTPYGFQLPGGEYFFYVITHPIILNPGDSIDAECEDNSSIEYEVVGLNNVN